LQEDVRKYLLTKDTDLSSSWLSFDTMIKSIIKISDRNLHIFKNRLGIGLNSPQTLDDSGSSFGLTRERTRQILSSIQKKLNTNINNNLLMPFWLAVDLVLDNYQGLIYSNDIATEITDLLGWYTAIEGHAIIAFSELTNKYFIDKEYQLICNKDDNCLDCLFREDFLNHISYSFDKFVISDLIHDYHENYCSNCKHYNSTKLISEGQVKYQLHKTDFSRFYVFHEGSYYSHSKFEEKKKKDRRKQLRENHSAKILFEDFLNSLPCYASQDEIQAFLLKNGLNFDYGLASLLQRSEDVYSWGRGLYIHKSKVYISDELAIELKNYITQNLDNKNQYLAIQKVFNENKELCIDQNIPNKIALYTVLSLSLSHYFQFPGSPLITSLSNKYPQSLPILLEHYILSFEKGIEYHNVKNYFVNVIGISFRSFRFQISNNPAIFKLQKDILIHKKYIINIDEENNISQFVEALLSKGKLSEFALQNHLEESGVIKSLSVSLSSLIANNKNIDTSNDILSLNANSLFYYLNESEIKSNISNLNFIGLDNESIRDYLVSELIIQNDKVLIFEDENPLDDILSEFG